MSDRLDNIKDRIFKPALAGDPIPGKISNNANFTPYFDNCIGAIDGTHIPAVILVHLQGPHYSRKKFHSQNVLGVANLILRLPTF